MTEAELQALESATNTALLAALSDPKPSYRIGEYSVNHNEYIKSLRETLSWCRTEMNTIPFEEVTLWRDE